MDGHLEEILPGKGHWILEWAVQGGDRDTIPRGIYGKSGCGTRCPGLVDRVVLGPRLDSVISETFPYLIDSVTCLPPTNFSKRAEVIALALQSGSEQYRP